MKDNSLIKKVDQPLNNYLEELMEIANTEFRDIKDLLNDLRVE
jgi:hypothetical protein